MTCTARHPPVASSADELVGAMKEMLASLSQNGMVAPCGDLEHVVQAMIPELDRLFTDTPEGRQKLIEALARCHQLFNLAFTAVQEQQKVVKAARTIPYGPRKGYRYPPQR